MNECERLDEADRVVADACGRLGLPKLAAFLSDRYDRIEVPIGTLSDDEAARLREEVSKAVAAWSGNWDAWTVRDRGPTLCLAQVETCEDSE